MSLFAACMLLCLPLSAPAQATTGAWFYGQLAPQQQAAQDTVYNLRYSYAHGYDWVGTAAHVPGSWTLYGSWVTAWNDVCHSYAAGNSLGSMLKNDSGLYNEVIGGSFSTDHPC